MTRKSLALFVAGLLSLPICIPVVATSSTLPYPAYTRFTLPNGLTVVVHEDHKAPIVTVSVWYRVGSADELKGKTGFAHLFEHLMFSGSENHRGSYFKPFELAGATDMNGTTWFDRTNYYETVPVTALDMTLWMESDRMGHLLGAIGQKELDTQRGVVQNEKRQGENRPHGRTFPHILAKVFPRNHPYQHDTIGSMADLNTASLTDVKQWFHDYYGAANTTLVLAGDITLEEARAKTEQYFGDIPAGPPLPRQQPWITPLAQSARGVQHDHVAQPSIYRTWVVPQLGTDDAVLLELAASILGNGHASRLYRRLVTQDNLADNVSVSLSPFALASLFQIQVDVKKGANLVKVEAAMRDELKKILTEGPTANELELVKNESRASFVRGMEVIGAKATILAESQIYRGDPGAYERDLERADAATTAAVKKALNKWLGNGDYLLTVLPAKPGFDPEKEDAKIVTRGPIPGRPPAEMPAKHTYAVTKTQIDRSKGVPQVTQFPDLKFPKLEHGKLKNGIEVILAQRHTIPVTNVQLMFDAGYAADPQSKPGTAYFTTAMMNESTKNLDTVEITQRLQRQGTIVHVGCKLDSCSASLNALNSQLQPSLALFSDIVRNPAFRPAEIERKRVQILAGIAQEKTQPDQQALRILPPMLYGAGHAYGAPFTGLGTRKSIQKITASDLKTFWRNWLRPDNAKILVVGDTTLQEIVPRLDVVFGDWQAPARPLSKKNIFLAPIRTKPHVILVDKPGAPQSSIYVGLLAPSSNARNEVAIDVANGALGGGFTSRLNMNLREDKRWAYGASSTLYDAVGQRLLLMEVSVQTDKTAESMLEVFKEANEVIDARPLTEQEVGKVKFSMIRGLSGNFESNDSVLNELGRIVKYNHSDDYTQTLKTRIEAVQLQAAENAIKEIIHPNAMTFLVIGDLKKINKSIHALNLGKIEIIND